MEWRRVVVLPCLLCFFAILLCFLQCLYFLASHLSLHTSLIWVLTFILFCCQSLWRHTLCLPVCLHGLVFLSGLLLLHAATSTCMFAGVHSSSSLSSSCHSIHHHHHSFIAVSWISLLLGASSYIDFRYIFMSARNFEVSTVWYLTGISLFHWWLSSTVPWKKYTSPRSPWLWLALSHVMIRLKSVSLPVKYHTWYLLDSQIGNPHSNHRIQYW